MPITKDTLPPEGFVDVNTAARTFSVSRSTIYNWVAEGFLPQPARIGPRRVGFDVRDLRSAIDAMRQGTFLDAKTTSNPGLLFRSTNASAWVSLPADIAVSFAVLMSQTNFSNVAARAFFEQARRAIVAANGGWDVC